MLTTAVTSFSVTMGYLFMKDCLDDRRRRQDESSRNREENRLRDQIIMNNFKQITSSDIFVPNDNIVDQIVEVMATKVSYGGVLVLGAPRGTGKSTYLQEGLKQFRLLHPNVRTYCTNGLPENLLKVWKVPPGGSIASVLPYRSLLIFDKVHEVELSPEQESLLVYLATQSVNTKYFHVIISVSNAQVIKKIVSLNGRQKLMMGFHPLVFQWSEDHMMELVSKLLPTWDEEERSKLVRVYARGKAVGILYQAATRLAKKKATKFPATDHSSFSSREDSSWQKLLAESKILEWKQFGQVGKYHLCYIPEPSMYLPRSVQEREEEQCVKEREEIVLSEDEDDDDD